MASCWVEPPTGAISVERVSSGFGYGEEAATKVELEGQPGRGGHQREGRYSLAGLEFRDRRDCMTPKVRFLDGVVCVLLSRGALILQVACRAP